MKKILAIICLLVAGILLGSYFKDKPLGQLTVVKKEINGIYCKVYASFDDLVSIGSTSGYDAAYGNIMMYNVNNEGNPFILVCNPISGINEGGLYNFDKTKEVIPFDGQNHQVYYLSEPDDENVMHAVFAGIFIVLFAILMIWGYHDDKKVLNATLE